MNIFNFVVVVNWKRFWILGLVTYVVNVRLSANSYYKRWVSYVIFNGCIVVRLLYYVLIWGDNFVIFWYFWEL